MDDSDTKRDRVLKLALEYRVELVAYARSLLGNYSAAEDAVQEAMLVVVNKIDQFQEGTSMLAWCRAIVRLEVLRIKQQHRQERSLAERLLDDAIDAAFDEFQTAQPREGAQDWRETLESCLERVPKRGRSVLQARFVDELSYQQIGQRVGMTLEAVRKALEILKGTHTPPEKSPSERGEIFNVPLLSIRQGNIFEPFEETHLLEGEWRLLDHSLELSETEFPKPNVHAQGGRIVLKDERVSFEHIEKIEHQLAMFDYQNDHDQVWLVSWLERNLHEESITPDEKAAFLNGAITYLIEQRGLALEELLYAKFRLREALERKMQQAKDEAMKKVYQTLIGNPSEFTSAGNAEIVFESGRYAYDYVYSGFIELPKHFFPHIGNLKTTGEEFECAKFIATELSSVEYWVRNVERKPTSFSLQTATDRFYPDFLVKLTGGRVLAIEYKRSDWWDLPDSIEKRQLGELWEKRSDGKCLFVMTKGKDWESVKQKVAG